MELELNLLVSFAAGFLSFLSPCVLAIAPAYIGYISGVESLEKERRKVVYHTLFFVLGFIGVFVLLGIGASFLGNFLFKYKIWFNRLAGLIILIFGLQVLGVLKIRWLYQEKRLALGGSATWAQLRSFILGVSFGFGWTPCIGPILGSILLYVSVYAQVWEGGVLLSFYGLGLALPFIILGIGWGKAVDFFQRVRNNGRTIEIISGILLIFLGVILILGQMETLLSWTGLDTVVSPESLLLKD
ncbi:MAG: cytochrome c-type biosis protein [Candidatus Atribacteria bacterium]|nr:cytochrome c-type biosis protein [Candidatus Atribacteria bacterium]